MGLLHQLGELFLQAAPTAVIVFLFYFFLKWAFFNPIQRVMAQREARTEGARAEAEAAQAAARAPGTRDLDRLMHSQQDKARGAAVQCRT